MRALAAKKIKARVMSKKKQNKRKKVTLKFRKSKAKGVLGFIMFIAEISPYIFDYKQEWLNGLLIPLIRYLQFRLLSK